MTSKIIVPNTAPITVSRQFSLGVADYDVNELYAPDTEIWKSKVLDLASPKYSPNKNYIFDRSRYNNHGTITGATWSRLPSGLPWLYYATDDYTDVSTVLTQLAAKTVGTLSIWAMMPDVTPATNSTLLSFGGGASNEFMHIFVNATGLVNVQARKNGVNQWLVATDASPLVDNKPFRVSVTHNGTTPVIWVNGAIPAQTFSVSTDKTIWFSQLPLLVNGFLGKSLYSASSINFYTGYSILANYNTGDLTTSLAQSFARERSLFGV